jgi:Protein of unknown function (DUF2793)
MMSETTARHAIDLLQAGQAQKEVTHNEALVRIDALLHPAVTSRTLTVPPATPADGGCWIVAAGASGAWAGRDGQIACWHAGGWMFIVATEGCLAWSVADGYFLRRTAGDWTAGLWPTSGVAVGGQQVIGARRPAIADATGGATVDAEVRNTVALILATMRSHGLIAVS